MASLANELVLPRRLDSASSLLSPRVLHRDWKNVPIDDRLLWPCCSCCVGFGHGFSVLLLNEKEFANLLNKANPVFSLVNLLVDPSPRFSSEPSSSMLGGRYRLPGFAGRTIVTIHHRRNKGEEREKEKGKERCAGTKKRGRTKQLKCLETQEMHQKKSRDKKEKGLVP